MAYNQEVWDKLSEVCDKLDESITAYADMQKWYRENNPNSTTAQMNASYLSALKYCKKLIVDTFEIDW